MLNSVPCTIFRGGTSKGVFFLEKDIPPAGPDRDLFLLKIMGSPDLRQIDGLGGAVSTTSKVAIISKADGVASDVNYTFAQVSIDKPVVDYKGNCGNISSAVGPYAVEMGLAEVSDPETIVRIYNTNTKKVIYSHVKTPGGKITYDGDFAISGVPGTASEIKLAFKNPSGSVTGSLLPTGNPSDLIEVEGFGRIEVSIVDAANPLVFVRASDIGLTGRELPEDIDTNPKTLAMLEAIRGMAAIRLGLIEKLSDSATLSPAVPKMTVVSKAETYTTAGGEMVGTADIDMLGRMMSMQKTHKTYALTGALCTAAAAVVEGSIVHGIVRTGFDPRNLRIGHPGGIIQAGVETERDKDGMLAIPWAFGYRTARLLMKGTAFYR
ncbi:MAG: PrpF domain-containing protein [Treponemataceae bacterium]